LKKNVVLSAAIAAAATLLAATTAFAVSTYLDTASGNETMATSTQGWFSGNATGDLPGSWSATIVHTPLAVCSSPCQAATISGGSFSLKTTLNLVSTTVTGHFQNGTVSQTGGFTGCTNQTFDVLGNLNNVGPGGGSGTGRFAATLTHYRFQFFSSCITYGATVKPPTGVARNISLTF
jgi:hypothetical protein